MAHVSVSVKDDCETRSDPEELMNVKPARVWSFKICRYLTKHVNRQIFCSSATEVSRFGDFEIVERSVGWRRTIVNPARGSITLKIDDLFLTVGTEATKKSLLYNSKNWEI